MAVPLLERIRELLEQNAASYRVVQHAPTFTSEQSAQARGEDLRIGAKALLLKTDETFRLFVLSAACKLDSRAIKTALGVRKTRFATKEELFELTGLEPGAVPPFGAPLQPFELYADPSVFENERVAFNAGSLTDSVVMSAEDYRRVAQPILLSFSAEEVG